MAISDIASLVVRKVLDEANTVPEITASVGNSLAAEPGPPTGVRPFTGADASTGALMAKLGARVFQRARERRMASEKEQKAKLDEEYRRAQIEHLTKAATPDVVPRDQSVTVGERTFTGLTADQAARLQHDISNDPAPDPMLTNDERGKPLPFPMKRSEYLTMRGQNLAEGRAAAGRALAERLAAGRTKQAGTASTTLAQTRYLGALPSEGELWNKAVAQATAQDDSTTRATGKVEMGGKRAQKQREQRVILLANDIYRKAMHGRDSLMQAPLRTLRTAAVADSADAAQPIQLPQSFQDLFNQ